MNELKLIELFGAVESLKSEFDPMYREIIGLRAENEKLKSALKIYEFHCPSNSTDAYGPVFVPDVIKAVLGIKE